MLIEKKKKEYQQNPSHQIEKGKQNIKETLRFSLMK